MNISSEVCHSTAPVLFADNTNIFFNGMDPKEMQSVMNEELLNISKWFNADKLSVNIKKPHYMSFTNEKHIDTNITLVIGGESICEVQN